MHPSFERRSFWGRETASAEALRRGYLVYQRNSRKTVELEVTSEQRRVGVYVREVRMMKGLQVIIRT